MADQISKIKSKRQVFQLKSPHLCLQTLIVGLFMLALSICSVQTAICSPSVPSSAGITTEQYNFSGYNQIYTYGLSDGPVSNSLYYVYRIFTTSNNAAVRKVDASGSQTWMASFDFWPIIKSLSVDAAEQSVYLVSYTTPLVVLKLAASDGSIVSQHQL